MLRTPLLLTLGLLLCYLGNGFSAQNVTADSTGNLLVPVVLLARGALRFTPQDAPTLFRWQEDGPSGPVSVPVRTYGDPADPDSAAARVASGRLRLLGPKYTAVPSRVPGVYVNTFGVGAGLAALPVFAVAHLIYGDLRQRPPLWFRCGKIAGALFTAGSAALLYLAALRLVRRRHALLAALIYGLCTCAFAISSQTLWQHGPAAFFLAALALCLLRRDGAGSSAWAGLWAALAVACRPTLVVVVVCVGVHLLLTERRRLLSFALGGLPVALLLAIYNTHYLGSPLASGQVISTRASMLAERGHADPWSTPLWEGAAGLLLSPGRGLFFYSPVLLLALVGIWLCFRRRAAAPPDPLRRALRPLLVAALLQALVAFKWYDWWGGVCYGYRPLVDVLPALTLALAVALPVVLDGATRAARARRGGALALLLLWSLLAQVAGAYAAEPLRWNFRRALLVQVQGEKDPRVVSDKEELLRLRQSDQARVVGATTAAIYDVSERYRLWKLGDNPIRDDLRQLFHL